MADPISINGVSAINTDIRIDTVQNGLNESVSNNNRRTGSKIYDYSAIMLTDEDKQYRLDIKKQADALLAAAQAITNRFPPLFTQMINSYNETADEIMEMNDSGNDTTSEDVYDKTETKPEERLDVDGISNTIVNFMDNLNSFISKASESNSYTAQSTVSKIESTFNNYSEQLEDIGITYDNGFEIDRSKLENAISDGSAEKVLTPERGFTDKIAKIAEDSIRHSDSFIEKTNPNMDNRPVKNTNINYNYITNATIDN